MAAKQWQKIGYQFPSDHDIGQLNIISVIEGPIMLEWKQVPWQQLMLQVHVYMYSYPGSMYCLYIDNPDTAQTYMYI